MRKSICFALVGLFILSAPISFAALTTAQENYLKGVRSIKIIQKQIREKQEEKRIAISTLRNTFDLEIQALRDQLKTAAQSIGLTAQDFDKD